ncbi:MAG: transposase [Bacteroidetes bacterium]|nr:transposase [Bacteroidota bacterium]
MCKRRKKRDFNRRIAIISYRKGIPGPALLAFDTHSKNVDHLPLYRQIEQFKRLGVEIPSSTMSRLGGSVLTLDHFVGGSKRKILQSGYLQADETTIKVLDKNIKAKHI